MWCGPLNGLENRVDLIVFQVINRPLCRALEWNPQDTLCEIEMLGVSCRNKTKKRMDGREPHVARGRAIIALAFEVRQECKNRGWGQVGKVEGPTRVGNAPRKDRANGTYIAKMLRAIS